MTTLSLEDVRATYTDEQLQELIDQPTPNLALLTGARAVIATEPERHEQSTWAAADRDHRHTSCPLVAPTMCGTAFCLAGWVLVMLGWEVTNDYTAWIRGDEQLNMSTDPGREAGRALGLTGTVYFGGMEEEHRIFEGGNSLVTIDRYIEQIRERADVQDKARRIAAGALPPPVPLAEAAWTELMDGQFFKTNEDEWIYQRTDTGFRVVCYSHGSGDPQPRLFTGSDHGMFQRDAVVIPLSLVSA